jgi:phosphatidylinositol alpha-1,6-mannosyltransferase
MNTPADAQVLLFVGSIIKRKGVDTLVELFLRLSRQRAGMYLCLVGANCPNDNPRLDQGFVDVLRHKLSQANLADRVIWAGLVADATRLTDYYLASDIFVFPTRAEGLPSVVLEAMSCDLPVVASLLPGATDAMVTPGETGFLVEVDDLGGFEQAVTTLLDDPSLRRRMGAAGRARVEREFGFDAYCRKLAQFYREVAGRPAPANHREEDVSA